MPAYPRRLNACGDSPSRRFPKSTPHQPLRDSPRGEALKGTRLSQYSPVAARRRTPMSFRALVEKSPAGETKTNVHDNPKYSPPSAHGRKTLSAGDFSTAFGLRPHSGRNDILNQAGVQGTPLHIGRKDIETRPAVVIASEGVAAAWQSPGREH